MRPHVAFKMVGEVSFVTVLAGSMLGVYEKRGADLDERLKAQLAVERLSAPDEEALDERVAETLTSLGWRFSTEGWRSHGDPELRRRQREAQAAKKKSGKAALRKALRSAVLEEVEAIYARYRQGSMGREPCLTASLLREMPLNLGEHRKTFLALSKSEQTSAIQNALTALKKGGKLATSTGIGMTGRETSCYEPVAAAHRSGRNPHVGPEQEAARNYAFVIDEWTRLLKKLAAEHNLTDPEGRADFRGAMQRRLRTLPMGHLRDIGKKLGLKRLASGRSASVRVLADRIITVESHRSGSNPKKKAKARMNDNHLPGGFHVEESDVHKAWLVMLDNEVMRILLKKHYTRKQAEDEARRMASPLAACPSPQPWKGDDPALAKSPKPERGFDADDYILKQRMRKLTRGR